MARLNKRFAILISLGLICVYYLMSAGGTGVMKMEYRWHSSSKNEGFARNFFLEKQALEVNAIDRNNGTDVTFDKKCMKKFNVGFLKVHKAGSTTLMNVFIRFALNNSLNIVLPHKTIGRRFNYLGYRKTVYRNNIVPIPVNESYNILCNHAVYNRKAYHSILPKDTVYIGIIREPVSHFLSAALYFGLYKTLRNINKGKVNANEIMSHFLKTPKQVVQQEMHVHNQMSFDFGVPTAKFYNDTFVKSYIKDLEKDFSLVLVLEHLQESLVLMKRTLCWDTQDIMYVKLNVNKHPRRFRLDSLDIKNLRKWNSADFILYEHFFNVFVAKINRYDDDFQKEVESFKSIQQDVETFCNNAVKQGNTTSILTVSETEWGNSFIWTIYDCELMMQRENPMLKRLIENAWSRYRASVATISYE